MYVYSKYFGIYVANLAVFTVKISIFTVFFYVFLKCVRSALRWIRAARLSWNARKSNEEITFWSPKNLPKSYEIKNCKNFLKSTISLHENLKVIVALGLISHKSIVSTFNLKQKDYKFGHSNKHSLSKTIKLIDSYHCSRYNINTKRLTQVMFDEIFIEAKKIILN